MGLVLLRGRAGLGGGWRSNYPGESKEIREGKTYGLPENSCR